MKLYQLTTTAIITLVSIIGNPLESFSQNKFFIPSALAQDSWANNPYRIEITEKTSYAEIKMFLIHIRGTRQYNLPISEADKIAIIEDLEKIEALKKNIPGINSIICLGYNIAEAWEKAIKACERSLKVGDVPDTFHNIHEAYFGAKKYNKAINSLKKSIKSSDHSNSFLSYQRLGLIYYKLGKYAEAIRQYKKAIESVEKYKKRLELELQVQVEANLSSIKSGLGFSLLRQGKIDAAEKKFFEAMKNDKKSWNETIVHFLDGDRDTPGIAIGGLWEGSLVGLPEIFTDGLTELHIQQGRDKEALEFAEYGRTRILSYLINKNRESSITIDEIKAIARQQNATLVKYFMPRSINYFEMNQTYEPKLYIWVVKPTGEVHFFNKNLSSVNSKYSRLLSNNHSSTDHKNSNSFPNLIPFIPLLILITGIFLSLKFSDQRNLILISSSFIIFVTIFPIINNQTTTSSNQNSEISLAHLSRNTFTSVRGNTRDALPESATEGSCQNDDDCLKETHKVLIEPIAKLLPKNPEEEVIIIPDGELFRVPFAALKGSDNQYLIQKHTLRISPSIKLLQFTQQQKARKSPNLSSLNLVVGNPLMPRSHNGQRLTALPDAEKEAVAIAQLLNTIPITGRRATKSRITRLMPNANIIHLATHGTPFSLAFAPSRQDQGFLGELDIYQLNLTADLVVLSACETGLGEITSDGVVGIARPFVGAGVPSVVISLWKVPDSTTSELMIDFYKNLQAQQNKAQALRQAMLTTMKKYPEPLNWAGFFLVGES
ncbi:MAG: CHAT domain-containing protein [Okeania sp. SIO3B5]|uniref:CHAT domain-containing protein n=1 Tax=Okeania sp. SIO3B5 TaxID=2607811 RepID=UPI0014007B6C|nr:CHAT domain-containing tetratricopeptide repeat protein [Okeania sp. SIO3B5]NEO54459.1 CHAT domain-containing protein [Okeania sp. SIO3B5]